MLNWDFSFELLALALLSIVAVSAHDKRSSRPQRDNVRMFRQCVDFNLFVLLVEFVTQFINVNPALYSLEIRWAAKIFSSICCLLMVPMYCRYIFGEMFSLNGRKRNTRWLEIIQMVLFCLSAGMLFVPSITGLLFQVNEEGIIVGGPYWFLFYIYLILVAILYGIYMMSHRKESHYDPVSMCLAELAILYITLVIKVYKPEPPINALIGALISFVAYIAFQSRRVGTDELTRLGNKIAFINEVTTRCTRKQPLNMVLLTVTNLDRLNNALGYSKGDEALLRITTWLRNLLPHALLFRYSPSSFAVLRWEVGPEMEEEVHMLEAAFEKESFLPQNNFKITANLLSLTLQPGTYTPEHVVEALYEARHDPAFLSESHLHFDNALLLELDKRKHLIDYLQRAIREKRFHVYYQPIYCVRTGRYEAAEALVRLRDGSGKFISPAEFVPVAEEAGLIAAIDEMVVEMVCAFLAEHSLPSLRYISVNLSEQELQKPGFADTMQERLTRYGLAPDQLGLEITERMLIRSDSPEQQAISRLHESGYFFLLDDFGTGFSNFAGTLKFPLSKVKLDRSLVGESDARSRSVCSMLVDLFHRNNQEVVAEGIETPEQQQYFSEIGVDYIQGYYHARPLPENEFVEFLRRHEKEVAD